MRVSLLVFLQFTFCWSGKPIDYTPLLKYLDDDIIRDLVDPIEGRGQTLIDYVETYNNRLCDIRGMIQQDIYEAFVKAIELQKIGGPQFLKVNMDNNLLKKIYNWTEDDIEHLQKMFASTKELWKNVEGEFESAEARFKIIHEEIAKEKAEQEEMDRKRVEQSKKDE